MQRERQNRNEPTSEDIFDGPQGFTSNRSIMSSIFGGRGPFDDPFFNRPFNDTPHPNTTNSKELLIEEIDSDGEGEDINHNSGKDPLIQHPDDEAEEVKKELHVIKNHNRIKETKQQTQSVSYKKVTYGGINGAYYTATTTRKSGTDGVVLEDSKEADKTTGQATHRISKGIHDKGHSVTRKLGTDGTVDTVQTLHNLNEDELSGFEEAWKGNADMHIPGWNEEFNSFGRAGFGSMRPFGLALWSGDRERASNDNGPRASSSSGGPKKVVTINIE